jgi:hypothetical protein
MGDSVGLWNDSKSNKVQHVDLTYTLSWVDGVMTVENYATDNFNLMTSWSPEAPGHLVRYRILS